MGTEGKEEEVNVGWRREEEETERQERSSEQRGSDQEEGRKW